MTLTTPAHAHEPPSTMRLSDFARMISVSSQRVTQLRLEGRVVVARREGRSVWVDVPASLARLGLALTGGRVVELGDADEHTLDGLTQLERAATQRSGVPAVLRVPGRQRSLLALPAAGAVVVAESLERGCGVSGMSKGQFSLMDLIRALCDRVGEPADVWLTSWSIGIDDQETAAWLVESGAVRSLRWVVDYSHAKREPEFAAHLANRFGKDAIAEAKIHAKMALVSGGDWKISARTSMNLNRNPRHEQFDVDDDSAMHAHYEALLVEISGLVPPGIGVVSHAEIQTALARSLGGGIAAPSFYAHASAAVATAAVVAPSPEEVSYHSERALHERAKRALTELRLAEARRELRSASSVRAYCGEVGVAFRERMLALESSAATRLDAADQVWLAAEIRRALSECADTLDRATERLLEGASLTPAGVDGE